MACVDAGVQTITETPSSPSSTDSDDAFRQASEHDEACLVEDMLSYIESLVASDPLVLSKADFGACAVAEAAECCAVALAAAGLCGNPTGIAENAWALCNAIVMPLRSYSSTFVPTMSESMRLATDASVRTLVESPQADQRTQQWYAARRERVTASSAWKIFAGEAARNNLLREKCSPAPTSAHPPPPPGSPMLWGVLYEPLSVQWYEHHNSLGVTDFGCMPHRDHPFLAASPDGIVVDSTSPLHGRMLEIKNVVNRVIDGIPSEPYWIQMQLQMEVCNLPYCDFLETRFVEYDSHQAFVDDGGYTRKTREGDWCGVFMRFNHDGEVVDEYPPWLLAGAALEEWESDTAARHPPHAWLETRYWRLQQVSCVLIPRNPLWFSAALPELRRFWDAVLSERASGREHKCDTAARRPAKPDAVPARGCLPRLLAEFAVETEPFDDVDDGLLPTDALTLSG